MNELKEMTPEQLKELREQLDNEIELRNSNLGSIKHVVFTDDETGGLAILRVDEILSMAFKMDQQTMLEVDDDEDPQEDLYFKAALSVLLNHGYSKPQCIDLNQLMASFDKEEQPNLYAYEKFHSNQTTSIIYLVFTKDLYNEIK